MSTYSHPALTPSFMSSKIASCASSARAPSRPALGGRQGADSAASSGLRLRCAPARCSAPALDAESAPCRPPRAGRLGARGRRRRRSAHQTCREPDYDYVARQLAALRQRSTLPIIFTVRTASQGGMCPDALPSAESRSTRSSRASTPAISSSNLSRAGWGAVSDYDYVARQLAALRQRSTLPIIFTVRTASQGGMCPCRRTRIRP
jgi:hypothetical protein